MKVRDFAVLVTLSLISPASAHETLTLTNTAVTFTNLEGRIYAGVDLVRANLDGLIWRDTNGGGGQVSYTNLSKDFLLSLGIAPDAITKAKGRAETKAKADAAQQQANAKYAASLAAANALEAEVLKLAYHPRRCTLIQALPNDDRALVRAEFSFDDVGKTILLMQFYGSRVDGSRLSYDTIYQVGTFTYKTVLGASSTIDRFTTDKDQAIIYIRWLYYNGPMPSWFKE